MRNPILSSSGQKSRALVVAFQARRTVLAIATLFVFSLFSNPSLAQVDPPTKEVTENREENLQTGKKVPGKDVSPRAPKQKSSNQSKSDRAKERKEKKRNDLIKNFEKYLTGATLEGHFTVTGSKAGKRNPEKYSIVEAKRTKGDRWVIKARIQYGKKDLVVPVGVKVLWAGETPVITLERTTIIGMGTFSSRVLFNEGMYSGTWKHDDHGGHLFGKVIPKGQESTAKEKEASDSKEK